MTVMMFECVLRVVVVEKKKKKNGGNNAIVE